MSKAPTPLSDTELTAYFDRELDAAGMADIEQRLVQDPDAQARLAEWRRQTALITGLYGPAAREPLPDRLNLRRLAARERAARQTLLRMAAVALLCLGLGSAGGWLLRTELAPPSGSGGVIAAALAAHRLYVADIVHPVQVRGDAQGMLGIWLAKRLGHSFAVPDLAQAGWQLIGGSLLPAGNLPAAQVMYEDAAGRRLTLFFTANSLGREDAPRFARAAGLGAMSWTDGSLTCTIVGPLGRAEMRQIAAAVYQQEA